MPAGRGAPEPDERHFDIAATLESVSAFAASLGSLLPADLSAEDRSSIELAAGEALVNIVRHGYAGQPGHIAVELIQGSGAVTLELRDWGKPIPPAALDASAGSPFEFDPDDLDAIPESGMGLPLIRLVFDEVGYTAAPSEGNRLLLRKNIRRT